MKPLHFLTTDCKLSFHQGRTDIASAAVERPNAGAAAAAAPTIKTSGKMIEGSGASRGC